MIESLERKIQLYNQHSLSSIFKDKLEQQPFPKQSYYYILSDNDTYERVYYNPNSKIYYIYYDIPGIRVSIDTYTGEVIFRLIF